MGLGRKIFRFVGLGLLIPFLLIFVGIPTFFLVVDKWKVDSVLHTAKSIQLIHYNPYVHRGGTSEIVYATKDLDPKDFYKVSAAFPLFLDFGFPCDFSGCLFEPHHRIVITDETGKQTVIRVCFLCDHYQIGPKSTISVTPFAWRWALRRLFEDEGMPYQPDRYMEDYIHASSPAETGANTPSSSPPK